jgi:hypothetical protein
MSEYDLVQDVNVGQRPKETKEPSSESHDATGVANAIAHGRPETLGPRGAMHVQRAAGNAAMGSLVQRQSEEESPVHQVIKGGGSSLDSGVRSQMEGSLGYDFSGVRVHTGPDAAKAATSVQAQAFTVGNDVVFNEGKYDPSSDTGKRTIAHELTHVVQQSQGSVPGESRAGGIKVSDPGDWAEQQAEATADSVMSGDHHAGDGHDHGGASAGSVQTLPLQRAAEEDALAQTLRDPSIQRAAEEDELQTMQDPSIQRAAEEENEKETEE